METIIILIVQSW